MRALVIVGMVAAAASACAQQSGLATAVFAGGRFWALESAFEGVYGVLEVVAGYTGGSTRNATRESYAQAGHVEAVRVRYDPSRASYAALLDAYWRAVDPTDAGGQFTDRGAGYRSAIFWSDQAQRAAAESSRAALASSGRFTGTIVTEIRQAAPFVVAEPKEQDYARLNVRQFQSWRASSGRDKLAAKAWGEEALRDPAAPPSGRGGEYRKPSKAELKKLLTPLRYAVTQENDTEPPFQNELWNEHRAGIYVDVVSGEPLFSSLDKFDSGTGWPSFTHALAPANVVEKEDRDYGMVRVEVRSRYGDSHLGHLFDDGPAPTGLRYCINSASLRFVPVEAMEKEGYGRFLAPFKK